MITEIIFNATFIPVFALLDILPTISLQIPTDMFKDTYNIFAMVLYVFPLSGMLPMFVLLQGARLVQIAMAIVVRIKSFIPTMGA